MKQAIILAGGFGSRLREVVSNLPKPLAPVNGVPFLEILLNQLNSNGFRHVILSVGHLKEKIIEYFGENYKGIKITYVPEDTPLGTGGAIKKSLLYTKQNQPCFILNGDSYLELNFENFMRFHQEISPLLSIATCFMKDASRYGVVEIDENSKTTSFIEKQNGLSGYINAGIYIAKPKELLKILPDGKFSFENFMQKNTSKLNIFAYKSEGLFIDIGIPEDYHRAQALFSL